MFSTADPEDISQVTSLKDKSSSNSDVQDTSQNTQMAKQPYREITLNMLLKELVICVALAVTTYGALLNTPSNISKHPQAKRFFSRESLVTDWYKGQLTSALAIIDRADIAFVMYYAPWDAECQYVRGQFEKTASILGDRVTFAAINCWHPGSECRLQLNKIPTWPVIMVYTINSRGILYKGPREVYSMVKFLELIMNPLQRVTSIEGLVNLLSTCDAVAVGYTPLVDTPKYYNIWNSVAIRLREYDTIGELCFASVSSEVLANELGVEVLPTVRLMLWNETKEYSNDESQVWEHGAILSWLLEHFSQPVERVIPLWKKAFTFERYANGNPLLILFTPLNPLFEQIPMYSLLRVIAMEYFHCDENQWRKELMKLQNIQRLLYQQKDIRKFCNEYNSKHSMKKPTLTNKQRLYGVTSQQNKYPWTNSTLKNQKDGLFEFLIKRGLTLTKALGSGSHDETLITSINLVPECTLNMFPAEQNCHDSSEQCHRDSMLKNEEELYENLDTTMLPEEDDPLSADHLLQEHIQHFCKLTKFAYKRGPPVFPAKDTNGNVTHIHGLACSSNHTLNMVAVDSLLNHHFAESLGIDIRKRKDMTAVVILDSKHESQYILKGDISAKSLRDFIINFTNKTLTRMLRARVEDALHTHFFESGFSDRPVTDVNDRSVDIVDLSAHSFRKFVKTPNIVSIVCVCGGACPALVSRAVLSAVRLLRACGLPARGARLDALRHDLPWHYTPDVYPTLYVMPTHGLGEAESLVYPSSQRVTAGGLVALVLRTLSPPQHLRVRLALCTLEKPKREKTVCLADLKQHVTTLIGRSLKYWRRFADVNVKDSIFKRLLVLHRVSFELSLLHVSDIYEDSDKQSSLITSLSMLAKYWNIDHLLLTKSYDTQSKVENVL